MMIDNVEYKPLPQAPTYGIAQNGDVVRFKTGKVLSRYQGRCVKVWYDGGYISISNDVASKQVWEGNPKGFKPIPIEGLDNFLINEYGEVFSKKHYKIRKAIEHRKGYLKHSLWNTSAGKSKGYFIHRLVALTYIGKSPEGLGQVNHIDGDKTNNHYTNLEWCDAKHNTKHATVSGLRVNSYGNSNKYGNLQGEKLHSAKLTEKKVIEIREWHWNGRLRGERTWEKYDICETTYFNIVHGRKWKYLNPITQTSPSKG